MVVAIEKNMQRLGKYLSERGYVTVSAENYDGPVDAYVYKNNGFFRNGTANNFLENNINENGILMINAKNKSYDEILGILVNKVYGDILNFF